jgi:glycosyltransferase involved in cell wall biosynthesis
MKDRSRRIKVFLGAFVNQTNAQNLNCLTLAKYMDPARFKVFALAINHGNLGRVVIPGVSLFNCYYPVKATAYLGYLWGIAIADVVYLPRGNFYRWQRFLVRMFGKKSFKTIENIIDDTALTTALSVFKSKREIVESYTFCDRNFSITNFMKEYNRNNFGLDSDPVILPLATDTIKFRTVRNQKSDLRTIVFMGNDMRRKNVLDVIALAEEFPNLNFVIVGREDASIPLEKIIAEKNLRNVTRKGMLSVDQLLPVLSNCDLHLLPSRSEGFPRGIIEMASAGIPTITYRGYGAEEWITNGVNGFVVESCDDIRTLIKKISEGQISLSALSNGAIELGERFGAERVVRQYENIVEELVS